MGDRRERHAEGRGERDRHRGHCRGTRGLVDAGAPHDSRAVWLAGCGALPFDNFETRLDDGRLLVPYAVLGGWLDGRKLYVNRLAGIGA